MALLDKVKVACRVTSAAYDDELSDLISAALEDMGITDINPSVLTDDDAAINPLVRQAVVTFCRMYFGTPSTDVFTRLKESYDEQKAQMLMSSEFTNWGSTDA